MNLSGLSEATKAKIAKAHPDIAKQFAAGASVSSLVKKNPALAKQFGISLMNLSSDDDLMNLSGLSEATKAKIAKAHPEIAKQFAAGASVSSLVKKNPALAKQFGVSLMNLSSEDDFMNLSSEDDFMNLLSGADFYHNTGHFMNLSSEDDLMNLSGLSEATKAKIAKAHPDIAK